MQSLLDQVDPNDLVARSFVEQMLPTLLERYAGEPASGGYRASLNGPGKPSSSGPAGGGSMLPGRLLNGIFPTLRLLTLVETERAAGAGLSDTERRVYVVSYLLDALGPLPQDAVSARVDRVAIEEAKARLAEELRRCNVEGFFPGFAAYLEDIAFLVLNGGLAAGEVLPSGGWRFSLPEQRIRLLCRLCAYSAMLAGSVRSPRAIQFSPEARELSSTLAELSGGALEFCYHQLREERGLLSNAINDGLIRHLREQGGIWPYLFFPEGAVYIKRTTSAIHPTSESIAGAVRAELRDLCANRIKSDAVGFKFSPQGIAKHPGYYYEFLTIEDYGELLARATIMRTRNDISSTPLEKLRQMQGAGEIGDDLAMDFAPELRIGLLARFYSVVFSTLLRLLDKKQADLREDTEQLVVSHLGLSPYWEQSEQIPNKGGLDYRWFWLGACYLRDHPTIPIEGAEEAGESISRLFHSTVQLIVQVAGDELGKGMPRHYLGHLAQYLDGVVELSPAFGRGAEALPDFYAELERFNASKMKGGELMCTLCNGAFPTEAQSDSAVLFQPWVYKNKLPLYAPKSAGGVCVICALELMLRQILQKGSWRLTGKGFERLRTKYLALYPDLYYTQETGAMVRDAVARLQNINFFALRRQLGTRMIDVTDVQALGGPSSTAQEDEEPSLEATPVPTGAEVEGESEEAPEADAGLPAAAASDGRYIKYHQEGYPGLVFFGMWAGKDDDDAGSWAIPAFLSLALPLVTPTRIVLSESLLPLYASGAAVPEVVVFDAPPPYLNRLLKGGEISAGDVIRKLQLLTGLYLVNLDLHARGGKPEWGHLPDMVRDLETDPAKLFSYLRDQQRGESIYMRDAERYLRIYELLEADLSRITTIVEDYRVFYRGGINSHSILKPIDLVAKAIIDSPVGIDALDLQLQIQGQVRSWLDRVRNHQTTGYALFWGKKKEELEGPAVAKFVSDFYQEVFLDFCRGERNLLRRNLNGFKDGCEVYYKLLRKQQHLDEQEQELALAQEGEVE